MGLSLQNIDKIVGRETHLKDISLEFESGSRNVLLGRTLAGKTSLLRIMAGIDRPKTCVVSAADGPHIATIQSTPGGSIQEWAWRRSGSTGTGRACA